VPNLNEMALCYLGPITFCIRVLGSMPLHDRAMEFSWPLTPESCISAAREVSAQRGGIMKELIVEGFSQSDLAGELDLTSQQKSQARAAAALRRRRLSFARRIRCRCARLPGCHAPSSTSSTAKLTP